jgi:hypothetical protein
MPAYSSSIEYGSAALGAFGTLRRFGASRGRPEVCVAIWRSVTS